MPRPRHLARVAPPHRPANWEPGRQLDPAGRDHLPGGLGGQHDVVVGCGRDLADQMGGGPVPVGVPHRRLHGTDPVHVLGGGDLPQHYAVGQHGRGRDRRGERDHDRLGGLGYEARGAEPVGQVGWFVVSVGLPFDRLAAGGEVVALPGDQPVEVGAPGFGVSRCADEPAHLADHTQQRAIGFVPHAGGRVRRLGPGLRFERGEQGVGVLHAADSTAHRNRFS